MTQIIGQIESLKRIRQELNQNGITRFNSIGQIKEFLSKYDSEIHKIIQDTEFALNDEIENLQKELIAYQQQYNKSKNNISDNLNYQISSLIKNIAILKSVDTNFFLTKIFNWFKLKEMESRKNNLERDFDRMIERSTNNIKKKINKTSKKIEELMQNMDDVIAKRSQFQISKISKTKRVLENLNPLIAGAIGENLVVKELKKLPDDYILINDFSMKFNPPIYNRRENDKIFSIQIDHLLLTKSGIFVIETKNWSKKSIERYDLRSPIEQIRRTSYALFVMINSEYEYSRLNLKNHHWGNKQIPIRNVIAMINEKPKEKFQYVTIKSLHELIDYFYFFDPIFTNSEVKRISSYLSSIKE